MTTSIDALQQTKNELDFSAFEDFSSVCRAVLGHMHGRMGFPLWAISRVEGDDMIVLQVLDNGLGVKRGDVFRFAESISSRMTRQLGPHIAPRLADFPAYLNADLAKRMNVAAYVGVPLVFEDGTLFGVLEAFDTSAHPEDLALELPFVRLMGRMLSTVLTRELKVAESARISERALVDDNVDFLTELGTRNYWDGVLRLEEERCSRYGHPACVISVTIEDLESINANEGQDRGDEILRKAATAMRNSCRSNDVVARVGGDDFAILAVECDTLSGRRLIRRLERAFVERGVGATLGLAGRDPSKGLEHAWHSAVRELIDRKRQRKTRRGA